MEKGISDNNIFLGEYNIADNWKNVTLEMFSNYVRYISELKENEEADSVKILEIFSDIPKDVILQLPVEMFDKFVERISFINDKLDINEENASADIIIDNQVYQINYMESMKMREYLDLTTLLDTDKYNYPYILAILCRKPDEEYTEEYSLTVLPQRVKVWQNLGVMEALPLINFFILLHAKYVIRFQNSSKVKELKEVAEMFVENFENLCKHTACTTRWKWKAIIQLRKWKRLLNSI